MLFCIVVKGMGYFFLVVKKLKKKIGELKDVKYLLRNKLKFQPIHTQSLYFVPQYNSRR